MIPDLPMQCHKIMKWPKNLFQCQLDLPVSKEEHASSVQHLEETFFEIGAAVISLLTVSSTLLTKS